MNQALSSDRNQEGDIFTATLTQPVVVNGVVVAQRGQTVMGRVAEATRPGAGRAHPAGAAIDRADAGGWLAGERAIADW